MRVFPILDDYFQYYVSTRIMRPHSGRDLTSRFLTAMAEQIPNGRYRIMGSIVSELLTTATFRRILAVYYSLLRWYFVIDAGDAVTDFRIRRRPRPNEMVWPDEFELNLVRGGDVCVRSYDASWLERVLDGAPPGDAAADVAAWMQRFDAEPALATEARQIVSTVSTIDQLSMPLSAGMSQPSGRPSCASGHLDPPARTASEAHLDSCFLRRAAHRGRWFVVVQITA